MKSLHDGSAIYMNGLIPVCEHGVGYPDICQQCQGIILPDREEIMTRVFTELKIDLILWRVLSTNR